MKKFGLGVFILICFLLLGNLVIAANLIDSVDSGVQKVDDAAKKIDDIKNTKWDYLGKEWKAMFLKNSIIKDLDSFFTKFSIVFKILLGMNYSLSLVLFFVFLLWLIFIVESKRLLKTVEGFGNGIALLISIVLAIIISYFHFFEYAVRSLGNFIFSPENYFFRFLLFCLVIILFIFADFLDRFVYFYIKKENKILRKDEEELNRWTLKKIVDIYKKRS